MPSLSALAATLSTLTAAKVITWSKINDDRACLEVTVTVRCDPNCGYDEETRRAYSAVEAALAAHGLSFIDGGIEDDGSGEYWIFRAAL
jgi:hypothetical protein